MWLANIGPLSSILETLIFKILACLALRVWAVSKMVGNSKNYETLNIVLKYFRDAKVNILKVKCYFLGHIYIKPT